MLCYLHSIPRDRYVWEGNSGYVSQLTFKLTRTWRSQMMDGSEPSNLPRCVPLWHPDLARSHPLRHGCARLALKAIPIFATGSPLAGKTGRGWTVEDTI